jgi:hypothetical protein
VTHLIGAPDFRRTLLTIASGALLVGAGMSVGQAVERKKPEAAAAPKINAAVEDDYQEAQAAYRREYVRRAEAAYQRLLERRVEEPRQREAGPPRRTARESRAQAWRIHGAAACFLKAADVARIAYAEMNAQGRQFLKYVCARNGISLP